MAQQTKKIKILFTIPNFDTAGSGKAMLNVATRLDPDLFEPHICCKHDRGTFFETVRESGLPVHIFSYTTPMKPYLRGLRNCIRISKEFRKIGPDIIHSFHYAPDYSEALSARMAGVKWIYTKKNMNWGGASKNAWLLRTKLANAILAQNTDMLETFFPGSKKTYLVPRGVNTSEFKPQAPKTELRTQWNIKDSKRILICVANLVPVKGVEILIRAFAENAKSSPDWILFVVGDDQNEYASSLKSLSIQLRMEEQVIFTGKQYNINDYLSIAEVFALPTLNEGRKEGSPVSLLEAMAAEKYVLASNIPGIRDQLERYPEHLIESGSVERWTEALSDIFKRTSEDLNAKGKTLRKHVLDNYRIEHEVMRSEKVYSETCKKSR